MPDRAPAFFPAFAAQLEALAAADQAMREAYLAGSGAWDDASDARGAEALRRIVEQIGWPTAAKVGRAGTDAAWIIAQHADHDLDFQKTCLALMRAYAAEDVPAEHAAYLEDRIAVSEGRPQAYGTQFRRGIDGAMRPHPVFEPEALDERRAAAGMGLWHPLA